MKFSDQFDEGCEADGLLNKVGRIWAAAADLEWYIVVTQKVLFVMLLIQDRGWLMKFSDQFDVWCEVAGSSSRGVWCCWPNWGGSKPLLQMLLPLLSTLKCLLRWVRTTARAILPQSPQNIASSPHLFIFNPFSLKIFESKKNKRILKFQDIGCMLSPAAQNGQWIQLSTCIS